MGTERKVVLVTGGARRIGAEICRRFAEAGWRVCIHCNHSRQEAEALLQSLPGEGHFILQADFLNKNNENPLSGMLFPRGGLIAQVVERAGRIDALVNSASQYDRTPLKYCDDLLAEKLYKVNFLVPFGLMRDFYAACGDHGAIVNMLDQRVACVDPAAGVYNFAKKSLRDATEACALAWAPRVRVNGVAPGIVLPPPGGSFEKMQKILHRIPMGHQESVESIANAVFLLATEEITGNILYLDGGLHLATPAETDHSSQKS